MPLTGQIGTDEKLGHGLKHRGAPPIPPTDETVASFGYGLAHGAPATFGYGGS